jgi:geranylgeranyl pyrophosphate synthase
MTMALHNLPAAETFEEMIDRALEHVVADIEPPLLRTVLTEAVAGGKRLRPKLIALACEAAGGTERDTVLAGTAFELLHVSSLVHDDIMDGAATRRGKPSVVASHGTSVAILAGDALVALAFRCMHRVSHPRLCEIHQMLSSAFLSLCEGQCADICEQDRAQGRAGSHHWMVERKTARLIEYCARTGGILANAPQQTIQALGKFGLSLGLAYQAMDDLLDAVGISEEIGKPTGLDAQNGRRTYLSLAGDNRDRAQQVYAMVQGYTEEACAALDVLPSSAARSELHDLAHSLLHRKF